MTLIITFTLTGSYNYLGFAEKDGPVTTRAIAALRKYGVSTTSARFDYGTISLHRQLEQLIARFLKKEGIVYSRL